LRPLFRLRIRADRRLNSYPPCPSSQLGGGTASRSPFRRSANFIGLTASPSRAGHETPPCDRGVIPPRLPQRAAPRGQPRSIFAARKNDSKKSKGGCPGWALRLFYLGRISGTLFESALPMCRVSSVPAIRNTRSSTGCCSITSTGSSSNTSGGSRRNAGFPGRPGGRADGGRPAARKKKTRIEPRQNPIPRQPDHGGGCSFLQLSGFVVKKR
jgi:hypothetical protein